MLFLSVVFVLVLTSDAGKQEDTDACSSSTPSFFSIFSLLISSFSSYLPLSSTYYLYYESLIPADAN